MLRFQPMPHYYFNVRNGIGYVQDDEGKEMPDLDAARAEAIKGARSIIASEVLEGRLDLEGAIEVADSGGQRVLRITYREAVSGEK